MIFSIIKSSWATIFLSDSSAVICIFKSYSHELLKIKLRMKGTRTRGQMFSSNLVLRSMNCELIYDTVQSPFSTKINILSKTKSW